MYHKYNQISIEDEIVPSVNIPNRASNLIRARVHIYLTKIARKTRIVDVVACGSVFSSFEELPEIRTALERELRSLQLSEMWFCILVVLYSLDPKPISATKLAYHVNQLEASITPALSQLASRNWIARQSVSDTQRILVTLSEQGRDLASFAIQRYFQTVRDLYSGGKSENPISPHDG